MKKSLLLLTLFFAVGASAATSRTMSLKATATDTSIKISSFQPVITNVFQLAELCGLVTGTASHYDLQVVVDYKTTDPGIYNTTAAADGHFCVLVNTYTGTAQVNLANATVK